MMLNNNKNNKMTIKKTLFYAVFSAWISSSYAIDLKGTHFESAGIQNDIDPVLIYSVALAESAKGRGNNLISPWAWAIRTPSLPFYGKTLKEAELGLEKAIREHGDRVDVGVMQINLKWHGHQVSSPSMLLDPEVNIHLGTRILKKALASSPNDLALGIGRYHHWADKEKSKKYGRQVLSIYHAIRRL